MGLTFPSLSPTLSLSTPLFLLVSPHLLLSPPLPLSTFPSLKTFLSPSLSVSPPLLQLSPPPSLMYETQQFYLVIKTVMSLVSLRENSRWMEQQSKSSSIPEHLLPSHGPLWGFSGEHWQRDSTRWNSLLACCGHVICGHGRWRWHCLLQSSLFHHVIGGQLLPQVEAASHCQTSYSATAKW